MSVLLTILIVLAGIVLLFLLFAALVKKDFVIERSIHINAPKQEVFEFLKLIRNQEKYSVWVMKDPNIRIVYTGVDGQPGFISSWTSDDKNVGVGAQEIKKLTEGENIEVEIRFEKPFKATNYAFTSVSSAADGQTRVINRFYGKQKYPMNVMNLMLGKLVGKDMQQNLTNMKALLEK